MCCSCCVIKAQRNSKNRFIQALIKYDKPQITTVNHLDDKVRYKMEIKEELWWSTIGFPSLFYPNDFLARVTFQLCCKYVCSCSPA